MPWRTSQRRGSPVLWETAASQETVACSPRTSSHPESQQLLSQQRGGGRSRYRRIPQSACQVAPYQRPCLLARVCLLPRATSPSQKLLLIVGIVLCLVISALQDFALLASFSSAREHFLLTLPLCFLRRPEAERKSLLFRQRQSVLRGRLPGESVTQAGLAEGGLTLWRPQRPLEAASLEKGVQSFLLQQQASGPRFRANDKPVLFRDFTVT